MDEIEQTKDILDRLEKLEKAVFASQSKKVLESKKDLKKGSLPDRILNLRSAGFFKQPKTAQEVHVKLQSTYACEPDRVAMALLRLFKRKLLRVISKNVNGKKLKAYVW